MKRKKIIFVFLLMNIFSYAQNQFVYIRYNPKHGNASAIIEKIDKIVAENTGNVKIFISNASTPIIASDRYEWEDVRLILLKMQTENEYYAEDEAIFLNAYFSELFSEIVNDNLHIKGVTDRSWGCTFIISEEILYSNDFEYLAENISINELYERMPIDIMTYNHSPRLKYAQIAADKMFNFNISE